MVSRVVSNAAYDWARTNGVVNWTHDGLNRDAAIAAVGGGYDARGNLTFDGTRTFVYDVENRLTSVSGPASMTLSYDPAGRLNQTVAGAATTQFLYDGDRLVAEYGPTGAVLRRYVHGPGVDEPLVWYEGAGLTTRRWLHQDHQGSVIAWSDLTGAVTVSQVFSYGPYGEPGGANWSGPRFRYTGQIMLPEAKLYHYKARVYDPTMGRFLQTDPVGYKDDLVLYMYVGSDPLNRADPTGLTSANGGCAGGDGIAACRMSEIHDNQSATNMRNSAERAAGNQSGPGAIIGAAIGLAPIETGVAIVAAVGGTLASQVRNGEVNSSGLKNAALGAAVGVLAAKATPVGSIKATGQNNLAAAVKGGVGGAVAAGTIQAGNNRSVGTPVGTGVRSAAAVGGFAGFFGGAASHGAEARGASTGVAAAVGEVVSGSGQAAVDEDDK